MHAEMEAQANSNRGGTVVMLLAVLAAFVIPLLYLTVLPPHQDLAGNALSGRLALTLSSEYSNYSIYFPPAEKFWFTIAALLSDATSFRLDLVVAAMTAAMVVSASWLGYLAKRATSGPSVKFFVLSLVVFTLLPLLFKNVYGLREHLIMLGFWPYLLLRFLDPANENIGPPLRIVIGLWLGVCLLFKYLYAAAVLVIELVDAIIARDPRTLFRIENLIAGGIVGMYLFLWLGIDPGQREAIGAMYSSATGNFKTSTGNALEAAPYLILAAIGAKFAKFPLRETVIGLALVCGAILVAALQERWYTHHIFPIIAAFLFLWWVSRENLPRLAHIFFGLVLLSQIAGQTIRGARYVLNVDETNAAFVDAGINLDGKRVGLLAMHPSPYNQVLLTNGAMRWVGLMNISYVAAEFAPIDVPRNRGLRAPALAMTDPGRLRLHDQLLRLWEDYPPDAILIDDSTNWPLRYVQVNWLSILSKDERFQRIMSHYRPELEYSGERARFLYFVRIEDKTGSTDRLASPMRWLCCSRVREKSERLRLPH